MLHQRGNLICGQYDDITGLNNGPSVIATRNDTSRRFAWSVEFGFNLSQAFSELFVLACGTAEIPDLLEETGSCAGHLRRRALQRRRESLRPDAQYLLPSVSVSGVNSHDD